MTIAVRPVPATPREYHFPRFTRQTLSNGLNVIIAPVPKLPLVTVAAVIDATAVADPQGKEGLAQLVARALKEGTTSRTGAMLSLDLEKLGTSFEAGADWDGTVASMTVLSENLEEAFRIFSEVLTEPAFRAEDVERLKAERLAERMQILDEPRGLADESFSRFIYTAESRYARPMAGDSRSVSSIGHDDARAFYERNYVPGAVTIVMTGDVTLDEGTGLVNSALGSWQGTRHLEIRKADTRVRVSRALELVEKPDAQQAEVRIGHVGVPRTHSDYFPIVVMNAILGGLFSSRINLNLREVHGYTYSASSGYDWRRQAGPFEISTAVQSEVTADAIAETLREVERMRAEGVTRDELTLAVSYLDGVFPIRYETTAAIASALANMVTFGLPENYFDTYRGNITAVTAGDVLEAARRHVRLEELQAVVVGNPEVVQRPLEQLEMGPLSVRMASES